MSQGIDLRIDYPMLEEMSRLFHEAAKQLEETQSEMIQVAATMEDGALLGETGEAFSHALRSDLSRSLDTLREKMEELVNDINNVVAIHRDGEQEAASRFR
jgi:uncharacterized protein YukE